MVKWIVGIVAGTAAALVVSGHTHTLVAQARAMLVQDVNTQGFRPFQIHCDGEPDPEFADVYCQTPPIPPRTRFVVEHVSGYASTDVDGRVSLIQIVANRATDPSVIYLPPHLREHHFADVGLNHIFASPVRLYVQSGQTLLAYANSVGAKGITMMAIGYLVNE
jgi:hypothetical protein